MRLDGTALDTGYLPSVANYIPDDLGFALDVALDHGLVGLPLEPVPALDEAGVSGEGPNGGFNPLSGHLPTSTFPSLSLW